VRDFLEGEGWRSVVKGLACVLPILFAIGYHKHFSRSRRVGTSLAKAGGLSIIAGKHFYTIGNIAKGNAQAIWAKELVVVNMVLGTKERFQ
jgi:hypothetical protein